MFGILQNLAHWIGGNLVGCEDNHILCMVSNFVLSTKFYSIS